jgi:nitric oxide synthase oxygenase domain/subunit
LRASLHRELSGNNLGIGGVTRAAGPEQTDHAPWLVEAGLGGLRPHDLRHHAITKLAESSEASEQTIMAIAGHVSREMLEHYSHIRQEAKRRAVESLDHVTITSQFAKWEAEAKQRTTTETTGKKRKRMVGTARFELATPCTPSDPDGSESQ